ncbi:Zn-ribbon domain-containing OB-fold protein [Ramlibacter sp.]|uniref:Zn-ribbon domain-containing OB-fold protein n=1 Tax=Ramlibacter sp. TaxID=1917967 RepID=UPI003D0DDCC9
MSTIPSLARPIPVPSPLTQPFWDAARAGRLEIQRCESCAKYTHPPAPFCIRCSGRLAFTPVSGRGTVRACTVMHNPSVLALRDAVPYTVIVVELDEQDDVLLVSNLPEHASGEPVIGKPVEVWFEPIGDGMSLPQFRLAGSASSPTNAAKGA